jgi:hypothetical protein
MGLARRFKPRVSAKIGWLEPEGSYVRRFHRKLVPFLSALVLSGGMHGQGAAKSPAKTASKAGKAAAKKAPARAEAAAAAARARAVRIIERYEQAIGGRAAQLRLTSRHIEATVEFQLESGPVQGTLESWEKAPNKILAVMTLPNAGAIVQGCDGKAAWMQTPEGVRDQNGEELAESLKDADFYEDIHIRESYAELKHTGRLDINGAAADILEGTAPGRPAERLYFDLATGLLVRKDVSRLDGESRETAELYFDDYRDVDGIKFPFVMREGSGLTVRILKLAHNVAVDDARFARPR